MIYSCSSRTYIPIYKYLPNDVDIFIQVSIWNHVSSGTICQLVLQLYHRTINEVYICHYRDKLSYTLLKAASDLPYGTPVEKLTAEFQLKNDVSFCYVLHDMDTGFVTYHKIKGDDNISLDDSDEGGNNSAAYTNVYETEVKSWRKPLKVSSTNILLVVFAWCHKDL